jgi:hypothetical protein
MVVNAIFARIFDAITSFHIKNNMPGTPTLACGDSIHEMMHWIDLAIPPIHMLRRLQSLDAAFSGDSTDISLLKEFPISAWAGILNFLGQTFRPDLAVFEYYCASQCHQLYWWLTGGGHFRPLTGDQNLTPQLQQKSA